jgi:hypothetical protein
MTEQAIITLAKIYAKPASFTKYYVYRIEDGKCLASSPIREKAIATAKIEEQNSPHKQFIVVEVPPKKKP